jgi:hypothetical protein
VTIQNVATDWLQGEDDARVYGLEWSGITATLDITTDDGEVPPIDDLQQALTTAVPSFLGVVIDVSQGIEHVVQ